MEKKIVVAGHICLDITPVFPKSTTRSIDKIFTPGTLVSMNGVDVHTGGVVSNTGLGFKMLGANVSLIGKVGKDEFGKIVLDILSKYQLDKEMIVSEASTTSYSVVLSPPETDRIFLHDPGANDSFGFDDLNFDKMKDAVLFHFGYPPIMRKMYQNEGEELLKTFQTVKEMGVTTSLDMAAVDENSDSGKVDWKAVLVKLLPLVDFFMPSLEEIAFMVDRELYETLRERAANEDMTLFARRKEIIALGDKLISLGAKVVLIKCGAPGMYLRTASAKSLEGVGLITDPVKWSNISHFEESYVPDRVLSATGAGDTSCAAFLYAVIMGYSPEICLQLATGTGASCVSEYDAISGLKTFEELLEKINNGWKKQKLSLI